MTMICLGWLWYLKIWGYNVQTHRLYDSIDFKLGKPMDVLFMAKIRLTSKEDGWMDFG